MALRARMLSRRVKGLLGYPNLELDGRAVSRESYGLPTRHLVSEVVNRGSRVPLLTS